MLDDQGKQEKAERRYLEAIDIRRKLAQKEPEDYRADLAIICNNLAYLLYDQGRINEAEPLCREAMEIYRELNDEKYTTKLAKVEKLFQSITGEKPC